MTTADEIRAVIAVLVPADDARYLVRVIDFIEKENQRKGGVSLSQRLVVIRDRLAAGSAALSSRQREDLRSVTAETIRSTHEPEVGTAEAAVALDCTTDNVREHCRRGNLVCRKVGRQHMITVSSLEALKTRLAERKGA